MGKPKITWTVDMTETLLSIRKTTLAKKEKGDGRALMNIVLEHWQELFPNSKVTVNALKIKLNKLTRGAEGKVSTSTETASNNDKPTETKQDKDSSKGSTKLSASMKLDLANSYELVKEREKGKGKSKRDLVSPYEKGQISLAGIISKIVKPRSDRFKVWEHFQGDVITRSKYDSHYYGMYGFMVKHDESSFHANYDTLYRFDPDKVLHLHKATDFAANFNKTVDSHMHIKSSGIVTNLDDCGIPNFLNERADQAGIQHPIAAQMNKSLHNRKQLTRVNYSDPKLEAKLWPHLFPFGIGGWSQDTCVKAGEYLKHVLLNKDARWRKDPSFSFHWYDRQIKMKLF
eukprot:gene10071-18717_t